MSWKDWSYSKKGGIIGLALYVIVSLALIPFGSSGGTHPEMPYWITPSYAGGLILYSLAYIFPTIWQGERLLALIIFSIILSAVIYFALGRLTGSIIGKIKSKN